MAWMKIQGTSWFKIWVLPRAGAAVKLKCLKRIIFDRFGTMGLKTTKDAYQVTIIYLFHRQLTLVAKRRTYHVM